MSRGGINNHRSVPHIVKKYPSTTAWLFIILAMQVILFLQNWIQH